MLQMFPGIRIKHLREQGATNENQTKGTSTEKVSGNMNMQAAETAAKSKSEINSSAVDAQSSANSQVQVASNAQTVNAVQVKSENNGMNSGKVPL